MYKMEQRNVVLLVLDTVRKDAFDQYAARLRSATDIEFDWCYAASSWSTPSHASILTGELAHEHGIHAHNLDFSTLDPGRTFLSRLPEHRTIATSTNLFAGPAFGFDTLFDEFINVSRHGILPDGINIERYHDRTDKSGVAKYTGFLQEAHSRGELLTSLINGAAVKTNDLLKSIPVSRLWDYGADAIIRGGKKRLLSGEEPFFFFANFMEAHSPYEPCRVFDNSICDVPRNWTDKIDDWDINEQDNINAESMLEARRSIYFSSIEYLDRKITPFVKDIVENTDKETTVIITADHGEQLAYASENGYWGHVGNLSVPLIHVPMCVVNPPSSYSPDTTQGMSHLDLGDLICAFAHGESHDATRTLFPAERIGLGVSNEPSNMEYWDRGLRCVVEDDRRTEWDTLGHTVEYRITESSREEIVGDGQSVPQRYLDLFSNELSEYKISQKGKNNRTDLDESTRESLEELGYL